MIQNQPTTPYVSPIAPPTLPPAWYRQPIAYIPLGAGALLLLVALWLKLRGLPAQLRARRRKHPTLDPEQLEEIALGDPPRIVDLRPSREYLGKRGHIRNSVNIPFQDLERRLGELDPEHPKAIVLVDETDQLSHKAADLLARHGYTWFYVLKGGFRAWRLDRMPTYGGVDPKKL